VHRTCFSEPNGSLGDTKGEATAEFVRTHSAVVDALTATAIAAEAGLIWLSPQPPICKKPGELSMPSLTTVRGQAKSSFDFERARKGPSTEDDALDP
jgi:hypothetical protein